MSEYKTDNPFDNGPCCDGCMCPGCWKGWVDMPKIERVMQRLEHITFNDVQMEHIPPSLFQLHVRDALDFLVDPTKT